MGFLTMEIHEGVEQLVENEIKWTWRSVRAGLGSCKFSFLPFFVDLGLDVSVWGGDSAIGGTGSNRGL